MFRAALATIVSIASCSLLFGAEPGSGVWPQWRGPLRDGVSPGAEWPNRLDEKSLTVVWQVKELGESYSGPVVSSDHVFTTETVGKKVERIRCLSRTTGKEIWSKQWEGSMTVPFFAARNGSWIRATPTVDGSAIYVAGIRDVLVCLETKDGTERWRFDFTKEFGSAPPAFGFASSPIADDTGVYVQAGGCFAKLDKKTGKPLWKTLPETDAMMGSAFSSPTFATIAGREQVVVQTRTRLAGVDRKSGDILWEKTIPSFRGMNILTPVATPDSVFTSTYGGNTRLISLKSEGEKLSSEDKWSLKYEGNMTTPVVVDGHAYLFGKDRRFLCVDLKTGKENWRSEERFGEYVSLVTRGTKILALDASGKLILFRANPTKFDRIDERTVSKAETWAHLAVAGDEVFIRDLFGLTAYRWAEAK